MTVRRRNDYTRRETLGMTLAGVLGGMEIVRGVGGDAPVYAVPGAGQDASPPIKTRMLWTWDHSTEWLLNRPGAQTIGACNTYSRTEEWFEADYTRLLEYCGRHHIDAVVVWGLLRDHHGGLESVKQLCEVAAKNKVRLLCGVGLCSYGGVYYEGDSPFSLDLRLQTYPEFKAMTAAGRPHEYRARVYGSKMFYHACPSRKENQEYIAESLKWLFKNLPLSGVQIESGDTGVCECKLCRDRRVHPVGKFSWEDMALLYPIAVEAVREIRPDAWILCETYSHPQPHTAGPEHPKFGDGKPAWADECLAKFPDDVFVEWVYDRMGKDAQPRVWTKEGDLDTRRHRHIMRAHFSTYWTGIRGELAIDSIAQMVQESIKHGAEATSLFGEVSAFYAGAALNYLALENLGSIANPHADVGIFMRDVAGPLLGGEQYAHDFLKYSKLKGQPDRIPAALNDIYKRCGSLPSEAARRWAWLGNFLAACADSPV